MSKLDLSTAQIVIKEVDDSFINIWHAYREKTIKCFPEIECDKKYSYERPSTNSHHTLAKNGQQMYSPFERL